jgi:hypothetical protein
MCFTHQIPWHEGMSCNQYDSQREHGDPDYQQTQGWLTTNSKNCPGANCGVSIEKGTGCFHMTCELYPIKVIFSVVANPHDQVKYVGMNSVGNVLRTGAESVHGQATMSKMHIILGACSSRRTCSLHRLMETMFRRLSIGEGLETRR